jgi:hypothetical protein
MTGCYITTLPFEFMRAAADFEPAWAGSYHIPRATVQPELWLRSQIWPQLDRWRDFEADDKATGAFIELLHWLRDVLLQDAVFLITKHPEHPVFRDPVFRSPQFKAFAGKVQEAVQKTFEEDRSTAIEKVIPEVSEKLRGLTAYQLTVEKATERRHFEMVQRVTQLEAQITNMMRMEYQVVTTFTPGGRLHRTEQFERRQGQQEGFYASPLQPQPQLPRQGPVTPRPRPWVIPPPPPLTATGLGPDSEVTAISSSASGGGGRGGAPAMTVAQEGPPQIRFPRTLRTVGDLYQLWRHGLALMPSVDELERRWGPRWRLRSERQLFSTRKVVMDEVVRLAAARGWSEEDAVRELEKQRIDGGNLSFDGLARQLKAARRV